MSTPFKLNQRIRQVICDETGIPAVWGTEHDRLLLPHEADRIALRVRRILDEFCSESVRLHLGRKA